MGCAESSREAIYLGVIAVLWAALLVVACRRPPPPPPPVASVPLSVLRNIDSASPASPEITVDSDTDV